MANFINWNEQKASCNVDLTAFYPHIYPYLKFYAMW